MTAPCTSSVLSKYKNNLSFRNNQKNMFTSSYNKILHDPECQALCCSRSFSQPMQANNFNDLEQYLNFTACYLNEDVHTTCENQFLYNVTTPNDLVPEFQEVPSQNIIEETGKANSELAYEKPVKRTQYFMNVNSAGAQCKHRSYYKGVIKRKRNRTIFSTEQIVVLEGVFKKRPYVSREERLFLSQRLHISEKAIKIWFQNRRRVTEKRDRDQSDSCLSDSTVEEVCNDYNTRLDYIESQINQNTDEYGYVTLDSKALTELVKLIDTVLSHSIDCHNSLRENKNNDNYLMYEPVSPDSLSDDNRDSENILRWEPSKPEESLQRLIDIHTLLHT